jgi:molybdenum cofactor guanylyltransferase
MNIAGVILAGGKGLRMNGANKALVMLGGKPLITHVAGRLSSQVEVVGVNANRDLETFLNVEFDLPIVPDGLGGSLGPLDGILGAMIFAKQNSCTHALTVSVDTPFIPLDIAERLGSNAGHKITVAASNGNIHGTCGLWPVIEIARLNAFIKSGKSLKVLDYLARAGFAEVSFEGTQPDPFFNINTPDDLAAAARWQ